MTQREREKFDREIEELAKRQRAGEFGPVLDTGGVSLFDLIPEILRPVEHQVLIVSKVKIGNGWLI